MLKMLIVSLALVGACCPQVVSAKELVEELDQSGYARLMRQPLAVVEVYSDNCVHCKRMLPQLHAAASREPRVAFGKIDGRGHLSIQSRLGVRQYPTIILFDHGKERRRSVGYMDAGRIIKWIQQK